MDLTSNKGRQFVNGKPLSKDLRSLVISDIIDQGGNETTGYLTPGSISKVSAKYKLHRNTVSKIWKKYWTEHTYSPGKQTGWKNQGAKLKFEDLQYIEFLKTCDSTLPLASVQDKLKEYSNVDVSKPTISRAIKNKLPGGPWSRKKTKNINANRFSAANLQYSQTFINFLWQRNPNSVKFMDEAGIEISTATLSTYGHAPVGERAINITKHCQTPSKTVNLLIGLDGVHCTIIDGASNTTEYLHFFDEAITANTITGHPILKAGDIVIVDNVAFHHNEGERALRAWLNQFNIEYSFTPKYSPDFNPVELCFGKLKTLLKKPYYKRIAADNLDLAVYEAVNEINLSDLTAFYKHTKLFQM